MTDVDPFLTATRASSRFDRVALLSDVLDTARVVVVDDEPANVALLERMLRSVGVPEVHGTTDPHDAARRCRDTNADLLLLDLHMPHKDGFAVLDDLHDLLPADEFMPVLVLTADATVETRNRALHAGATDFLTKPLDRIEVILRVRNLLHTRALYIDVQARNATLAAELDRRRAEEHRAQQELEAIRSRIDAMLEHGDYHMVFQPIIELAAGHTVGLEALARFASNPSSPPNEWFDQAHRVGRSLELEIAAVAAALDQFHQLPPDAFLAVNISPETATSPQLAAVLLAVQPHRVVLELTEHTRIDDYAGLLAALAPLRDQGVRIAVDDAGAGYAGLHHVLQLAPDLVKLDIALIQNIDHDPAKRALATALVTFAIETGATLVAEGIETADELTTLQRLGVNLGQGYHIARPTPFPASEPKG